MYDSVTVFIKRGFKSDVLHRLSRVWCVTTGMHTNSPDERLAPSTEYILRPRIMQYRIFLPTSKGQCTPWLLQYPWGLALDVPAYWMFPK